MSQAFADCLHVPCPACDAPVNALCSFLVDKTRFPRHIPCLERLRAAERQAS